MVKNEGGIHYYYKKFRETNHPYYWYYLANLQATVGLKEALFPRQEVLVPQKTYRQANRTSLSIVAAKRGDIDGDGFCDQVLLAAEKTPDSPLWKNITLIVQNGLTNQTLRIPLKNSIGYNPTLFLGDFTGNKEEDILIVIDTGGSAGTIYGYVFSYMNGQLKEIFHSDAFNKIYKYDVLYENQYKAKVSSFYLKEQFIIDLTYKGKDYLSEIYNKNETLKTPMTGWVNPLSGLYPVDFNRDGTFELEAYQRVAGRYNADSLGYVVTVLKWNDQELRPERQNVVISGGEI